VNKRVVIDTNVIVSATISPHGNPAKILKMAFCFEILPFYCTEILAEYDEVLSRSKFNHSLEYKELLCRRIRDTWTYIEPTAIDVPILDKTDKPFYDTARNVGAILITGNTKHYPDEAFIMTPSDFMVLFENEFMR
jgi:putative PIN family toxin of toxin-antitoxin system